MKGKKNIRNKTLNIAFLVTILCCVTSVKASIDDFYLPCVYIGADAQIRTFKFQEGYGANLYKRDYPQGNFYLGIKGNEFIGIECGYEISRSHTRSVFLPAGAPLLGMPQPFDLQLNVIARFQGLHTSLIGFFPILNNRFKLILAGGVVNIKIQLENTTKQLAGMTFTRSITLGQSKNVLRLMAGVQYMFNEYLGARANARWENTAQFKSITPLNSMFGSRSIAKANNSIIYGIGVFIQY